MGEREEGGAGGGDIRFEEGIEFLWPVDFDMSDVLGGEGNVEVFVFRHFDGHVGGLRGGLGKVNRLSKG
jgi:hypothetical protein